MFNNIIITCFFHKECCHVPWKYLLLYLSLFRTCNYQCFSLFVTRFFFVPVYGFFPQEMETIKEDGEEEEAEQEEVNKLINNHMVVKTFEELKAGGLNRKATFPRNFSTMSFMGNRGAGRRRTSKESIMSSYSRLDFTGSSIQLAMDVSVLVSSQCFLY